MSDRETHEPTVYVVRNEVDPEYEYHCNALSERFPDAIEIDFAGGERVPIGNADGVVLTGSTAGVYESDRYEWIDDQAEFVRELVERRIPTLGICFGHQIANTALGGSVEHVGAAARLVEADLADAPIFEGVEPVVPALHGDVVTDTGEGMEPIASADHARVFGTRHRDAPLWTVQFHPEITASLRDRLVEDFGWETKQFGFDDVTAGSVFGNFERLLVDAAPSL